LTNIYSRNVQICVVRDIHLLEYLQLTFRVSITFLRKTMTVQGVMTCGTHLWIGMCLDRVHIHLHKDLSLMAVRPHQIMVMMMIYTGIHRPILLLQSRLQMNFRNHATLGFTPGWDGGMRIVMTLTVSDSLVIRIILAPEPLTMNSCNAVLTGTADQTAWRDIDRS
jgi:hypothetical protein